MNPTGLIGTLPETVPHNEEHGCCGDLTLHGLEPSPGGVGELPRVYVRYDCDNCGNAVYVRLTLNDGGELCVDQDFAAAVHEATTGPAMGVVEMPPC